MGGYHLVRDGRCVAMVKDGFFWRIDQGLQTTYKNSEKKCDLGVIGQPILRVFSSFVGTDMKAGCKSLVLDVINSVMHDMYNDGWFDNAEDHFLHRVHDINCNLYHRSSNHDEMALDLTSAGGIFVVHAFVSILCVLGHSLLQSHRNKQSSPYMVFGAKRDQQLT